MTYFSLQLLVSNNSDEIRISYLSGAFTESIIPYTYIDDNIFQVIILCPQMTWIKEIKRKGTPMRLLPPETVTIAKDNRIHGQSDGYCVQSCSNS